MNRIVFDIDGVLTKCKFKAWPSKAELDKKPDSWWKKMYETAEPNIEVIDLVKKLKNSGFKVILHTSRQLRWRKVTMVWLSAHGVDGEVVFDKPYADLYVDDRAFRFEGTAAVVENKINEMVNKGEFHG